MAKKQEKRKYQPDFDTAPVQASSTVADQQSKDTSCKQAELDSEHHQIDQNKTTPLSIQVTRLQSPQQKQAEAAGNSHQTKQTQRKHQDELISHGQEQSDIESLSNHQSTQMAETLGQQPRQDIPVQLKKENNPSESEKV